MGITISIVCKAKVYKFIIVIIIFSYQELCHYLESIGSLTVKPVIGPLNCFQVKLHNNSDDPWDDSINCKQHTVLL